MIWIRFGFAALLLFISISCSSKSTEGGSTSANKDKIIGVWDVVATGSDEGKMMLGTTFEFGKDGKLKIHVKLPDIPKGDNVKVNIEQPPPFPYEVKDNTISVEGTKGKREMKILSLTDSELKLEMIQDGKSPETLELKKK